jgi:UDP-GlcNAc:undecaprenyl-phosphate GlcNAc-1-phosphate transferase
MLLSLFLTPVAIRISFRLNAIDHPDERKVHASAVSRLGGVAMVAALVLPILLFRNMDRTLAAFLAGAVIVAATGFLDDIFHIPPAAKFAGEILAAAVFVFASGLSLEVLGDFQGIGEIHTGFLAPGVTIFCMVGVMNALNLSDGLDGLAGGISAIACTFLGIFAYLGQDWLPLSILVALFGSLLGFLRYNTHPANLFMGDTGSLVLGYSLSAVSIMLVQNDGTGIYLSPVTVAAVLTLPILDTLLVMLRRIWHGGNPFHPDKTHLHHRLLNLGLPHAVVVPILYICTASFGFQAWFFRSYPDWTAFAALLALGAVIYGSVFLAQRIKSRWGERINFKESPRAERPESLPSRVMGNSARGVGWLIAIGLFVPTIVLGSVPRTLSLAALAASGFVAVLFPWKSRRSRSGICCGLTYAACACLIAILQVSPDAPRWLYAYLAVLSALVMVWVLLKMRYRGHKEILLFSSFEILLIGASLFIPFVLVPTFGLGEGIRRTMITVCLESISFLMATKILIRHRPGRDYVIAGFFLFALVILGAKGLLPTRPILTPPVVHASIPSKGLRASFPKSIP